MRAAVGAMREAIGNILTLLEQKAPLPHTASAMVLYRMSGDERHFRAARAWFETDEAELRAFEPASGLMVLRNICSQLDRFAEADGDEPLPG